LGDARGEVFEGGRPGGRYTERVTRGGNSGTGVIAFEYIFEDSVSGSVTRLEIAIDEHTLEYIPPADQPSSDWTRLDFEKCSHCPLSSSERPHCPVAANLAPLLDRFRDRISYDPAVVTVHGPERTYVKSVPLQNGLCAAMGLVMATSPCPYMEFLRPLARFHLPFAAPIETLLRVMSVVLLRQHFATIAGDNTRLDLEQLGEAYKNINLVNRGIAKRIQSFASGDAGANAVVIWHALASLLSRASSPELDELRELLQPSH
jgi:hypothetical protein